MINKFKMNQILQCFRSAPVSPVGEPAHILILNLKLVNRVWAPLPVLRAAGRPSGGRGQRKRAFSGNFLNRY